MKCYFEKKFHVIAIVVIRIDNNWAYKETEKDFSSVKTFCNANEMDKNEGKGKKKKKTNKESFKI